MSFRKEIEEALESIGLRLGASEEFPEGAPEYLRCTVWYPEVPNRTFTFTFSGSLTVEQNMDDVVEYLEIRL